MKGKILNENNFRNNKIRINIFFIEILKINIVVKIDLFGLFWYFFFCFLKLKKKLNMKKRRNKIVSKFFILFKLEKIGKKKKKKKETKKNKNEWI